MGVYSQLLGLGPDDEILTAAIQVELVEESKVAKITIKNTSPTTSSYFYPVVKKIKLGINCPANTKLKVKTDPEEWLECNKSLSSVEFVFRPKSELIGLCPNKNVTLFVYSNDEGLRFTEDMFLPKNMNSDSRIDLSFIPNSSKKSRVVKINGKFLKYPIPTTTLPPPPVPNKQTCCQVIVKGKTQLVGPALYDPKNPAKFPVTHTKKVMTWIEKVCPEKVIIAGMIHKTIHYQTIHCGEIIASKTVDEIPFQCMIDRDDANEGDKFEITGAAILCELFAHPANFGTDRETRNPVAWKFVEKEVVKICIRKKSLFGFNC
jgi:hypothetical protein